jgi:GT2 family glycosyltransferase
VLLQLMRRLGRRGDASIDELRPGERSNRSVGAAPSFAQAAIARMARQPAAPAIVVPVFNAARELGECLTAVLAHTPAECRVILIDDASPDPAVRRVLEAHHGRAGIESHRNDGNLGFTATVNRGVAIAGRSDVVLLNSDTKVGPRWLENLRLAAYCGERVGTATPFSNNAGAFSAPEFGRANALPEWLGFDAYARLVTRSSARAYPRLPTGNGFCMYLRRDCLDEVGAFDAEAFPRGYGEENDFCMRAARLGFEHVVDDATLVYHVRSASFGDERAALMKEGRAVIDRRYPEYTGLVCNLAKHEPLRRARERIATALAERQTSNAEIVPRLLLVDAAEPQAQPTSKDLSRFEPFRLRQTRGGLSLHGEPAGDSDLLESVDLGQQPDPDAEAERVIADWLVRHAIEVVHAATDAPCLAALKSLCEPLNIPISAP